MGACDFHKAARKLSVPFGDTDGVRHLFTISGVERPTVNNSWGPVRNEILMHRGDTTIFQSLRFVILGLFRGRHDLPPYMVASSKI